MITQRRKVTRDGGAMWILKRVRTELVTGDRILLDASGSDRGRVQR